MSVESRTTGFGPTPFVAGDRVLLEQILVSRTDPRSRVASRHRSTELDGVDPSCALVLANV